MNRIVVQVSHLSKRFKIYPNPWARAMEWASFGRKSFHQDFWALKDVSFEVKSGECLGIIGPNGSGKSTLLKILTRSLYPTTGTFQVPGSVLSLLELGTGFNPELTGRQNIYRSAQIFGIPKDYVAERIHDIQEFAEIAEFFDHPVKIYSSGIYIRLAFSMFVFLKPEILILDEGLAVGDIFFQQKCYRRLADLIAQGTSLLLVTHDISVISQYCSSTLLLDHGLPIFQGDPITGIRKYLALQTGKGMSLVPQKNTETTVTVAEQPPPAPEYQDDGLAWPSPEALLSLSTIIPVGLDSARCTAIALCDRSNNPCQTFQMGQEAFFYYEFSILDDIYVPIGGVSIINDKNVIVHGKNSLQLSLKVPSQIPKGKILRFKQTITLDLTPGEYTFVIGLATIHPVDYEHANDLPYEALAQRITRVLSIGRAGRFLVTFRRDGHALTHHGLCNLPGCCQMAVLDSR